MKSRTEFDIDSSENHLSDMFGPQLDHSGPSRSATEERLISLKSVYRSMVASRQIDAIECEFVRAGDAPLNVPCAGHEGVAVLHPHLTDQDWLHLHYRDKALMLARGVPPSTFFHGLLANAASASAGRPRG